MYFSILISQIGQELIKHHNWYTVLALVSALHSLITPDNQSLWDTIPPKVLIIKFNYQLHHQFYMA